MPVKSLSPNPPQKRTGRAIGKTNCWEFRNCQDKRCQAFLAKRGRTCYAVVGSFGVQRSTPFCLTGLSSCRDCDFFVMIGEEDQAFWAGLRERAAALADVQFSVVGPTGEAMEKAEFHERAKALSQRVAGGECLGKKQVISFRLGQELYAVDLDTVTEVRKLDSYLPVPCTPPHVLGLTSLRGSFLTLFDIRGFLNIPPQAVGPDACYIVTSDTIGHPAGILVDALGSILEIDEGAVTLPISSSSGFVEDYVESKITVDGRQVAVMDLKRFMANERLAIRREQNYDDDDK